VSKGITWRFFNERTGNPVEDNKARNSNRHLSRLVKRSIRINANSRKRKKVIWRIEGATYGKLIISTAKALRHQKQGDS
jgi:hypothetical protein